MTTDPLDQLRAANPVPHGSAPPVASVLARVDPSPRRARRSSWLIPGLALAVSAGVVALVVGFAGGLHRQSAARPGTTTVRTATTTSTGPASPLRPIDPPGGMRGSLLVFGAFTGDGTLDVPFQQAIDRAGHPRTARDWLARSNDGGRRWSVRRPAWFPLQLATGGHDIWAKAAVTESGGSWTFAFRVSHDGGAHWQGVRGPAGPIASPPGGVSIADGEVWALGSTRTADLVMRGDAGGHSLNATVAAPPLQGSTNTTVVAVSRREAYVTSASLPNGLWLTRDAGRSWTRLADPCPAGWEGEPGPAPTSALWTVCESASGRGGTLVRRGVDGGRTWQPVRSLPNVPVEKLIPASATVAWALLADGQVLRTTDAGRHWQPVWSVGRAAPPRLTNTPALTVQGPDTATVVVTVSHGHRSATRRTNLVAYTTTDGGTFWGEQPVRLPPG